MMKLFCVIASTVKNRRNIMIEKDDKHLKLNYWAENRAAGSALRSAMA